MITACFALSRAEITAETCSGEACDAEGEDVQSLLMVQSAKKAAQVKKVEAEVDESFLSSCFEEMSGGLCYRSCADMGAFEPRISASSCGFQNSVNYIQRCTKQGKAVKGAGAAPGLNGRPRGKCFYPKPSDKTHIPPSMCTTECKIGAKTAGKPGTPKFCCADGKKPTVSVAADEITCSCPAPDSDGPFWSKTKNVMITTKKGQCDTKCSKAWSWKSLDGVKYCCTNKAKNMKLNSMFSIKDYKVNCQCS